MEKVKDANKSFIVTFLNFSSKQKLKLFEFFHKRRAISQPDKVVPTAGARNPITWLRLIANIKLVIIPINANLNGDCVSPLEK